jgi:hypothetical protein
MANIKLIIGITQRSVVVNLFFNRMNYLFDSLGMVSQNSVFSSHKYVNWLPRYEILIPETINCYYFATSPHIFLKHKNHYLA